MWYLILMNSSFIIHLDMSLMELLFWQIKHLAVWLEKVKFISKGRCLWMPKYALWIDRSNRLRRPVWLDSKTGLTACKTGLTIFFLQFLPILVIYAVIVAYSFIRPIAIFCTNKQAEQVSFISARVFWFMDVRLVDIIFSPYMIPILILEDIERIKLLLIVIWSICATIVIWGCENDFKQYFKYL